LGPGILSTVLGAIAVDILFLPPVTAQGTIQTHHILHTCVFLATGLFISFLMDKLRNVLDRSIRAERELGIRVQERTAELAEANRELQTEKNKLLGILDQMREAVLIVNPQFEIVYANPATEREFGPIDGQKCYEYLSGSGASICAHCRIPEVLRGETITREYVSPKTGKIYDCFEAPISVQKGIDCKLKILHDITNRKNTETALLTQHKEIQRLSSELLKAQESERMRISRELHDDLGQCLTLVKLKIDLMQMNLPESQSALKEYCRDASGQVDHAIESMRRLSRALSPASVDTLGITIALRRMAEDFDKTGQIKVTADIDSVDHILSTQNNIMLYRIFQEGLNNAVKHSGATAAAISLKINEDAIHAEVEDNGKGFDFEKESWSEKAGGKCLGLTFMRERVRTLGGSMVIQSRKNAGTRLQFIIPTGYKDIDDGELSDISGR
jgi:signal transduction histidine kinase